MSSDWATVQNPSREREGERERERERMKVVGRMMLVLVAAGGPTKEGT